MPKLTLLTVGALLISASAMAAEPCEPPRIRDTVPLANALAEDKVLAAALLKAGQACVDPSAGACDAAKLECSNVMAATLKSQAAFDEGAWLRDMLLPFQGQTYPMTRQFTAGQLATDRSCAVDAATLNAASQRRLQQASKREALAAEYAQYAKWNGDAAKRCQTAAAAEQVRLDKAKADAEAAAVIAAAEATKQKQVIDSKKAAEEAAKKAEADRLAAEALKKKQAEEAAKKAADDQKKQVEEAKKQAEDAKKKAEDEQEKAQREAAAKQKAAEEAKIVADREAKKNALKSQQSQLEAQADAEVRAANTENERREKELLRQAELDGDKRVEDAKKRAAALKAQAAKVEIPRDDERSKGALLLAIGAGYGTFYNPPASDPSLTDRFTGPLGGAQLQFHLGFWGTAPAEGMASGFELRILGRYLDTFSAGSPHRSFSGLATGRYFIGRFGFGAGFDARSTTSTAVNGADVGLGPSLSLALLDTPRNRINLNVHWLGILNANLGHFSADFEMSFSYFTLGISGGDLADAKNSGFFLGGFVGGRLPW